MLNEIYNEIKQHYNNADTLVMGEGTPGGILLIGEAPGKEEVLQRRPFCGKAGKNLDVFLRVLGIERKDIFISNVCKFRPYRVSEKGTVANRPPTRAEIEDAIPFLYREICKVSPKLIVTLGNTPLRAVYGDFCRNIGSEHGKLASVVIEGKSYPLFALYHPASIIYNRALEPVYQKDLQALAQLKGESF